MARFSKDFTRQARYGMILSIVSASGIAALLYLLHRNFAIADWSITYGNKSYGAFVYLAGVVTLALAIPGFRLGWVSWEEVRNEKPRYSAIGFFVGAITICLAIIMLTFFMLRSQVVG